MRDEFCRTGLLLGRTAMERLERASVAIFGIGGVGSYAAEALVRCGVGRLVFFDADTVAVSNLNRQLIATHKTMGMPKVEVMRERALTINPVVQVEANNCFYTAQNAGEFDLSHYDYIVDAIDTVSSKITLVVKAQEAGVPLISSMGAGNKLDPTRFEVADIYETSICPLAKVMRRELKARGISALKVVYSKEEPIRPQAEMSIEPADAGVLHKRQIPGSIAFVPSVAGLILASEVVRYLSGNKQ